MVRLNNLEKRYTIYKQKIEKQLNEYQSGLNFDAPEIL